MTAPLIRMTKPLFPERSAYAFLLVTLLISVSWPTYAQWEQLPPLPEPNGGFICGAQGSSIVIVGGTNWEGGVKNWLRDIHYYDPKEVKWRKEFSAKLPHPIAYGVALLFESSSGNFNFNIIGGSDGNHEVRKHWIIDSIKTGEGSPVRGLSSAVVLSAGGQIGSRKFIVGGTSDAAKIDQVQKTAFEVSFMDKPWADRHNKAVRIPDYPGRPFAIAASAVAGAELFIFGGANWDAAAGAVVNASEAHAFSASTNIWRKLKPLPYAARGLTAVTLDERQIYLAGGFKNDPEGFTSDALIYDVKADSYQKAPSLPYAAMVGLVKMGEHVYCLGGEDKMKSRTDKFYRIAVGELRK